ncbi:uncharacterized protein LOC132549267 [Ylistrum balloti]|uniref:uncharacterized protein LOC132549267 n=1 Tax=Ylistrum balloti TaxID=509963 RepID=UPI002905BBBF|nr:uncharacterized protein LOC132549267 [Ylistrum balloti]
MISLVCMAEGFECGIDAEVCETSLIVEYRLTMLHPTQKKVYPYQGKLYRYDVKDPENATSISPEEVITADGWEEERLVIVANGSLPGPAITVYEGQRLVVHVINQLYTDTLSIHWHGQPQKGTPWMDGVAFVTQCPILPGQKFTYDFVARPKGTYWYHSHVGTQRTKGLYGALIVRDRTDNMAEHNLLVQGWNHLWSADMDQLKYITNGIYENRKKRRNSFQLDGDMFSTVLLTSVIINGRGRYYSNFTTEANNAAPLSVFRVQRGQTYRFRVINADILYPFRVSVDNHKITVVATDGYDVQPVSAESFIIQSGERYDFILAADQAVGNYWIRAQSLEIEPDRLHRAHAILRYDNAKEIDPVSSTYSCSVSSRCLVVNCPFLYYPEGDFTDCLSVDKLKALVDDDPAHVPSDRQIKEYFLNFGFPGEHGFGQASVNGRKLKLPPVSALTQPLEIESTCDRADCGEEKECECTYSLSLNHDDVVQMILVNMGKGTGGFHPVHLHGYSFYVLKIGYGFYNNITGQYIGPKTDDINCRGSGDERTSFCNAATWRNQSWGGDDVPGLNLLNPPRKDTLILPNGGYAVIRIKADNPGLWILHCHMQVHNVDGMAVLLNNSFDRIPKPSKNFPICHNFPTARPDVVPTTTPALTSQENGACVKQSENADGQYIVVTVGVLVGVLFIILIMMAYILYLRNQVKKATHSSASYVLETHYQH